VGGCVSAYGDCDNISVKSGLDPALGTFVDPSSNESRRLCNPAISFLVIFASKCTPRLPRTGTGAASAKLMMKNIRRVRVSTLCSRIFVTLSIEQSSERSIVGERKETMSRKKEKRLKIKKSSIEGKERAHALSSTCKY